MAKKSKLLAALDEEKCVTYHLEKQKKLRTQAAKRKRSRKPGDLSAEEPKINGTEPLTKAALQSKQGEDLEWESAGVQQDAGSETSSANGLAQVGDSWDNGVGAEIPLSDIEILSDEEKGDIIPHQRLTINNTAALTKACNSIALPLLNLPFSEHQSIVSVSPRSIPDVDDDLNRELVFHQQCLAAVKEAKDLLKKEGVPFSRPTDYFAEMIKSDEHMGKIKHKMTEEAANKKAAAEARKLRDLRKFGKQVQVAKLQERDKAKRETLDKINILKRKRKNTDVAGAEETDIFEVALDDASKADRAPRRIRPSEGGRGPSKRQKRDSKFGFGGKKRFAKSGDAVSTSDISAFSTQKMKGQKKGSQRLGKSRRAKKL
ncbi:MAG: hypothetical protein Q9170_005764 [Blastenia crenularia]